MQHQTQVIVTEQQESLLIRPGVRFGINGPHAARTMMSSALLRQALSAKLGAVKLAFEQPQARLNGDADWKTQTLDDPQRADLTAALKAWLAEVEALVGATLKSGPVAL